MLCEALLDFGNLFTDIVLHHKYTLCLLLNRLFQRIGHKIGKSDQNADDQDHYDDNDQIILPSRSSSRLDRTLDILEFSVIRLLTDDRRDSGSIQRLLRNFSTICIHDTVRTIRIDHKRIQFGYHLTDRLITQFRIFLHRLLNDRIKALRDSGYEVRRIRNRLL